MPDRLTLYCMVAMSLYRHCEGNVPGMGMVPIPEPVPWKVTHMPQAAELPNWSSFMATVMSKPLLQGRSFVSAMLVP